MARFAYRLLQYTRRHFVPEMPTIKRPMDFLEMRYGSGSWVVVMGMNELGCDLAHQFAQRNFRLVMVDDDRTRLEKHLQHFQREYPLILIKIIITNFALAASEGWIDSVMKEIDNMAISVLINACAATCSVPFNESSLATRDTAIEQHGSKPTPRNNVIEDTRQTLVTQLFPTVLLTQAILPRLQERFRKVQLRGAVIHVTATAPSFLPRYHIGSQASSSSWWFHYVLYQIIRNFTATFGNMISVEVNSAVDMLTIHPGPNVSFQDQDQGIPSSPRKCAATSIQQLRYKVRETCGGSIQDLQHWLLPMVPWKVLYFCMIGRGDK
jgi:NAD(P)-dependent dehydrogenase (short-subunit alcohol dehydrogenase family)